MPIPKRPCAAYLQNTWLVSKDQEAIPTRSCPLPTRPSPSASFPLTLIVIKGRRQGGKILLAAPANGESRRTTRIPRWLPHLSPSSSPAKAHFPLARRCELLGCLSHAYALTHARGQSTTMSRAIPHPHALVLTSGTHQ